MKFKNKRTGEIRPAEAREDGIYLYDETTEQWYKYELDLLAKWWEYYEEPKGYWMITSIGEVICPYDAGLVPKGSKQIGNYFETREEAEKVLEKLKAWKRLKDKGFEFTGWDRHPDFSGDFRITASDEWTCDDKDLDLLFRESEE